MIESLNGRTLHLTDNQQFTILLKYFFEKSFTFLRKNFVGRKINPTFDALLWSNPFFITHFNHYTLCQSTK
jgi:hypothetical protein